MKPEYINYKCLFTYPSDHQGQDKQDSTEKSIKYIPAGYNHHPKRHINTYSIDQTDCQGKLQAVECSENCTGENNYFIRKSERKRTKKVPFEEKYQAQEPKRAKKEKSNNTGKNRALYKKYGYLPKGEKRSPQLDVWMKMQETPEWNVWPEKYKPANCVPHKKILTIQETHSTECLLKPKLPDTTVQGAMLPVENAKLLNQPPMKGFLELSEVSTHEEGLLDITDFTPFYEARDSNQETHESRESSAPASVKPRVNLQVFLKKKEALFQEINEYVKALKEETIKWDVYRDTREQWKLCSEGEIQFKTSPKPEVLLENYQRSVADLTKAQKEHEHTKIKLGHLTARLKVLQKEASTLTTQEKPGLELLSISELIRRVRAFACFFLDSKSYDSLMSILAIEPYRREKSQVLSDAEPLIAKLKNKRGNWVKRTQIRKLTQLSESILQLKFRLMKIADHQHQLDESEAIDTVLENLHLFSSNLRTKQHDETYQGLTKALHHLKWDIERC